MKVFFLTNTLNVKSGWGRYSADIISALFSEGVEIFIALERDAGEFGYKEIKKILPHYSNYFKNHFCAPFYAWKLRHHAKECDLIHCLIEPYSSIAYWLSIFTKKKYILTTHGTYGLEPFHYPYFKKYFHDHSFREATLNICVSNYTRELISKFGLRNLTVIKGGIQFSKFSSKNNVVPFEKRKNLILTVGALKKRKGQHLSIAAFSKIAQKYNNFNYCIVGDQDDAVYFEKLKNLANTLGISHRIQFLCSISDEELDELYEKAKIFILTSINSKDHFEGFGLVYLEANAHGLPVIGSIKSGAMDAIVHGKTGFLVDPNDEDAIANIIDNLLSDENYWSGISKNATEWAKDHDWAKIVKEYVRIYELYK